VEKICHLSGSVLPHLQSSSISNGKSAPLSHQLYKVKILKLSSHQPILRDVQKQFLLFASLKEIIMGMRVGSSSAALATQSSAISGWQQRQQGMKDLFSKLNAGDLAGAQKAYAAFAASNTIKSDSPMGQLGDALKNGNLAAAEKIAQSLQKNRATSPVSAQANANNQQVASTLSMLRGQGGQIDTLV
jgi:hypothetical protein